MSPDKSINNVIRHFRCLDVLGFSFKDMFIVQPNEKFLGGNTFNPVPISVVLLLCGTISLYTKQCCCDAFKQMILNFCFHYYERF